MAEKATLDKIKDKERELKPLYDRMDKTRKSVYLTPYQMLKVDGKTQEDNVINVTMPYPAIIANTIINDLIDAHQQVIIEGDITPKAKNFLEKFFNDNFEEADEVLSRKGYPSLYDWWCNHVCIRSYIGTRYVCQLIDGKYRIDVLPSDMRYCSREYGNDGLNWFCNSGYRLPSDVKAEYATQFEEKGITLPSGNSYIFVRDWWSSDKNEVYLDDREIINQSHKFGEPPFVTGSPATGFLLRDDGYIAHESEDILFLIRGIIDEVNRSVSIEQTKAFELLRPPYEQEVEQNDSKPGEAPPKTGQTKKVKKGQMHQLLPTPDVNRAFLSGREDLNKAVQMGGVNDIDLGNVSQTVSAVWITAQTSIRKKFTAPRLKTISTCTSQLARMAERQYRLAIGMAKDDPGVLIGREGRKKLYKLGDFPNPEKYDIRYEYRSQSKTEEIANLAQFEAAPDLPMLYRLEHFLKVSNPQEVMGMIDMAEAKRIDPAITFYDLALSLARQAADIEDDDEKEANAKKMQSKIMTERGVAMLKQRLVPGQEQETGSPPKPPAGRPETLMAMPGMLSGSAPKPQREPQAA